MDQLTIVGNEDGTLVLATESGQRFTLPVDDILRSELRRIDRAAHRDEPRTPAPRPREIQQHIRAGMAAEQVAELLSTSLEIVRRFEGPVLAEREHIVGRALAVPVLMAVDLAEDRNPTFGEAIRTKLNDLHAAGERWASWKDETGWIIKLEFTAADIDHDARWSFDPRRSALAPLNSDAAQLSRQGPVPEGLIPRLRAVESTPAAATPSRDDEAFDSAAFGPRSVADTDGARDGMTPVVHAVRDVATKKAPAEGAAHPDTADLLEALRRRRGQREMPPVVDADDEDEDPAEPGPSPVAPTPLALFRSEEPSVQADEPDTEAQTDVDATKPSPMEPEQSRRRGGRASMPSWDEIVFGARADD